MLGSRSCWRAWIDLLAGMLFFSLEGAVVFFLVPRYLLFFWFSPVSSLSHHQDICYTEYVHIKIMKEETNGTHHRFA